MLIGLCLSFLLAVTSVYDRPTYFAERLYKSMKVLPETQIVMYNFQRMKSQLMKSHVYMYIQCKTVSNKCKQLLLNSTPENSLYGI